MTIFGRQSRAVRGRRRRFDWGRAAPALMFAATLLGVVLLLVFVDRTEDTGNAPAAPVVTSLGASR